MIVALQAVMLGIIEGLTEFLPISSTGHLLIAEEYMSFHDTAKIFTVVIQLGAILAVVWHYREDIRDRLVGFFKKDKNQIKFIKNIIIATLPAMFIGLLAAKSFEKWANPEVVAISLILGALVLMRVDSKHKVDKNQQVQLDQVTSRQALGMGLAQCVALIPGVSRSGASIVGGLVGGLNRITATTFSFYMAIPVMVLASSYKLFNGRHDFATVDGGATSIVLGFVMAFIVALIAIKWLLKYVAGHSFKIFVYYRIILGILVMALLA